MNFYDNSDLMVSQYQQESCEAQDLSPDVVYLVSSISELATIFFNEADFLCNFGKGHIIWNICLNFFLNFGQWLRRCCNFKLFLFSILAIIGDQAGPEF